jgi:hypothetical protein
MHHEFAHVLFRKYRFPVEEWSKINEPGWKYLGSSKDLLGQANSTRATEDLLHKGFICRYSQLDLKEDVSMYVYAVIERRLSLISAAARHKRVKQKLEVLIRFYEGINQKLGPCEQFEFLTLLRSIIDPSVRGPQPTLLLAGQAGAARSE